MIRRKQGKAEITSLNLKKVFKEGDFSQGETFKVEISFAYQLDHCEGRFGLLLIFKDNCPIVNLESGLVLWLCKGCLEGKVGVNHNSNTNTGRIKYIFW